jgi:RNA polymerase sigma factor (sigma-70 family)
MPGDRTDTELVLAVRSGDRDAFGTLFERWFDRVHDVARNIVRSPETAADVAQDTFIAAWERIDRLDNPDAFGGWLLRIARNRALDRLERDGRSSPQDHGVVTGLHDRGARDLTGSGRTLEPEQISASHDRDGLVRAAAVVLGEREASVLDLHLRHGLTPAEIAGELGVTPNNAHQLLFRMRKKLGDAIGAFVLFRRGRPACRELAGLLGAESEFDFTTFELVERHRRTCAECEDRRAALVAPEQLFSAAPILAVPIGLRSRVIEHLRAEGVPTPPTTAEGTSRPGTESAGAATTVAGTPVAGQRSLRGPLIALAGVAAVVVVLLVIAVQPRNGVTVDPLDASAAAAPTTTSAGDTATSAAPTTAAIEPRVGTTPPTQPVEPAADLAPTTAVPLAPPPAAPDPAAPEPPAPEPPPPVTRATTTTTTTAPPPAAPEVVRLFTPAPLGSNTLLCNPGTGTPHEFDWVTTEATSATLTIGSTSRNVPVTGPFNACGSSGQPVTLTAIGPGGSDSATTAIP